MIPGDHQRTNPGASRARHCVARFGPRRVDHANQPGEDQILLDAVVRAPALRGERIAGQPSGGHAKRPQRLIGKRVVVTHDLRPAFGRQRAPLGSHELAAAAA
jgi:hypothetical protein